MKARPLIKRNERLFDIPKKLGRYFFVINDKVKKGDFVHYNVNNGWDHADGIIGWDIINGKVTVNNGCNFYVVCRSVLE